MTFPTIEELIDIGCTEEQADMVIFLGRPICFCHDLSKEQVLDLINELV